MKEPQYYIDKCGFVRLKRSPLQKLIHSLKYSSIFHLINGIRSGYPLCCVFEFSFSSTNHHLWNMSSCGLGHKLCRKCQNEFMHTTGLYSTEMILEEL